MHSALEASFNSFGLEKGRDCAKAFAQAFKKNQTLLHLDFSCCNFQAKDAEVLNEGLMRNQSILGIHMTGNQAETDHLGFVKPLPEE